MNHLKKSSRNGKSKIAFMAIKPIYAERLLLGEKLYEFRKTALSPDLTDIIIYASSPVKKIVGIAEVSNVFVGSPSAIWEKTKHAAGISRKKYREYFRGAERACAIELMRVFPLDKPLHLSDVSDEIKIPQSFSYVDKLFFDTIISKAFNDKSCG
jgi:predicted transcriptional regulator